MLVAALGPPLVSTIGHWTVPPAPATAGTIPGVMARAALCTTTGTDAESFPATGSTCATEATLARFQIVAPPVPVFTAARITSVALLPTPSDPTLQMPLVGV